MNNKEKFASLKKDFTPTAEELEKLGFILDDNGTYCLTNRDWSKCIFYEEGKFCINISERINMSTRQNELPFSPKSIKDIKTIIRMFKIKD